VANSNETLEPTTIPSWAPNNDLKAAVFAVEELERRGVLKYGATLPWRILDRLEMADHVIDYMQNATATTFRKALMVSKVPRKGLSKTEQAKMDHAEKRAAFMGITMAETLKRPTIPRGKAEVPVRKIQ
jgi:hypothetical protein